MKRELSLLLLFTILLFSSSYFIVPVSGASTDSQEQSFISTPLPFWNEDNINIISSFNDDNQTVKLSIDLPYSKKINITGSVGAGTDYQVKLNVTYNSNMQSDFDDLRFYDNDKQTTLSYWIEEYTLNAFAIVWVKVIDDLDDNQEIYMYYGDSEVSSTSNGEDTFNFYEDWETESIGSQWTITDSAGSVSYSTVDATHGSVIKVEGNDGSNIYTFYSDNDYDNSYALRMRANIEKTVASAQITKQGWIDISGNGYAMIESYQSAARIVIRDDDGVTDHQNIADSNYNSWHVFESRRDGTDTQWLTDDIEVGEGSCSPDIMDWHVYIYVRDAEYDTYNDWFVVRKYIVSEPISTFNNQTLNTGVLDIEIPVLKYKNIKIETMFDTVDLLTNISFRFKGIEESNFKVTYRNDTQKLYFDSNYLDVSAYNLLRFTFELKYALNQFSCTVKDNESTVLKTFEKFTGVYKLNSFLCLNSSVFGGSMSLYYLSGDVSYYSEWLRDTSNEDTLVTQHDFGYTAYGETENIEHKSERSLFVSGFQFWRSEYLLDYDTGSIGQPAVNDWFYVHISNEFTFYYPNGTELYRIETFMEAEVNGLATGGNWLRGSNSSVEVYKHNELEFQNTPATYDPIMYVYNTWHAKFGIWRTQENNLGIKYNGDFKTDNFSNWSYWFSEEPLENFQCNITHNFQLDVSQADTDSVEVSFISCEYAYNSLDGVSEPHFSTTWWDGIPIIGALINGFIWVGNMIIGGLTAGFNAIVAGTVALFSPLFTALQNAIGAVAGGVWALFSGAIAGVTAAINALAAGIWGLFSAAISGISDAIGSIVVGMVDWISASLEATLIFVLEGGLLTLLQGLIDAFIGIWVTIVDAIGGIFGIDGLGTSISNFFAMFTNSVGSVLSGFGLLIGYGASAVSLMVTYLSLFGPSALAIAGIFIIIDIADALLENKLYKFEKYMNFLQWTLDIMFKIVNALVQFIGGIIP